MAGYAQTALTLNAGLPVPVSQTFDGLATSGTTNTWTDNSTVPGWYSTRMAYRAEPGSSTAGALYSFGASAATERALGSVASGTAIPQYGWRLLNSTGLAIDALTITYTGEQWRNGGNTAAHKLTFDYATGTGLAIGAAATGTLAALDFTGPVTGTTAGALDGNATANRTVGITATLTLATALPDGQEILLRWNDVNDGGNDHGLALDDFTVSFTTNVAPPAPVYYSNATGNLDALATYGTNTNGTGTAPPDFTTAAATYRVSGTGRTIGADWTVSGSGAKVVLETGAAFTVPVAFNFTGTLDLGATATLVQRNAAPALTFGAIDATSTIDFAQTGTYVVPQAPIYGTLKLTGGTKILAGNTTAVRGNLTVDGVSNFNGNATTPFSTLDLKGNFTLLNGTAFETADAGRFTLLLTSGAAQVLAGNGSDFRLFRVSTTASLATAGGSSHLVLGNLNGGGYTLATGTSLALNGNNLTFAAGNTSIGAGTGLLINTPGSVLAFNHAGNTALGTLRLGAGERPAGLTLNASGTTTGQTLTLGGATVLGSLTLAAGTLSIGPGNGLTIDGPLTAAATAALQGSATSSLALTGTGAIAGALLLTPAAGTALQTLSLNRSTFAVLPLAATVAIGTLSLTKGALFLSGTDRLIALALDTANPGNTQSYLNALTLFTPAAATATMTYPLGRNGVFRPLTLAITAQTAAATAYTARQNEDNTSGRGVDNSNGGSLTRVSSRRFYALTEEGTANFQSGNLTLTFVNGDGGVTNLASLRVANSDGPAAPYADVDPNGTPATTGTAAAGTITVAITNAGGPLPEDFALATTATDPAENPLPVELTRFAAARTPAGVRLSWATASEQRSAYFEVQRSATGTAPGANRDATGPDGFVTVATVAAQGTSARLVAYTALDANAPAVILYYRLRQVDTDGAVQYSAVVPVAAGPLALALLHAYPNPTADALTLVGPVAEGQPVQVLDLAGHALRQLALPASGRVSLDGLPAGTYLLRAAGRTLRVTKE